MCATTAVAVILLTPVGCATSAQLAATVQADTMEMWLSQHQAHTPAAAVAVDGEAA